MAAGYVILEWPGNKAMNILPSTSISSEFKLYTLVLTIQAVVYTIEKIIFQVGVHKQKPKVLSGYCSNNCKVCKLVEFHKHV